MEMELRKVCGAEDGWMLPEAFMVFIERAYKHRPSRMTTTAFLEHFQQVQLVDHQTTTYGMRHVMASTLRHWYIVPPLFAVFVVFKTCLITLVY